jgi:hypothetical protein
MEPYLCIRCGYSTTIKANFKKHLVRKQICPPKLKNVILEDILAHNNLTEYFYIPYHKTPHNKTLNCKYCDKLFNSKQSKSRHQLNYCKNKQTHNEQQIKTTRMENLVDKLRIQVKELMEEKQLGTVCVPTNDNKQIANEIYNNTTNQNTNNQNTNNQQINNIDNSKKLQINNYGNENLSHITDDKYKEILKNPYSAMSKLMNEIHFNDEQPENQNLRIPNIKNPFAETFVDGEWVVSSQYKLLCKAYSLKKKILHQAFLRIKNQLDTKTQQLYYEFKEAADGDMFVFQSQLKDIKAAIISGTRHKPPLPSRYALQ